MQYALANVTGRTLNGVIAPDVVTLSGGTANYNDKNIGTIKTVTLTGMSLAGAQAGNYSLTSVATTSANITVRTLHLSNFGADSKVYDGTTVATGTGFNDDRVSGDNLAFGRVAAFDTKDIGIGKPVSYSSITISGGTDRNNYVLASTTGTAHADITAGTLIITADNKVKTYGTAITGGSGSTAYTSVGLQNSEAISVTLVYGTGSAATAGVATYTGQVIPSAATGATTGNYTISYVSGDIIVEKADLTIAAVNQSKVYGTTYTFDQTTPSADYTVTGLLNSDAVSGITLTSLGAPAGATVAGSTYVITPSAALGSGLDNYNISYTTGSFTVTTANLSIVAANHGKAYGTTYTFDQTTPSTDYTVTGLQNSDAISGITLTSLGAAADASVAGSTYVITSGAALGSGLDNYTISYTPGVLSVTAAPLTIAATNQSKVYGTAYTFDQTTPSTDYTVTGLLNSDAVSGITLTSLGEAADAAVAGSTYVITPTAATGTGLNNYDISYTNGNLTVSKVNLTVTATADNKVYDGNTNATISGAALVGVYGTDDVVLGNAATGTFARSTIGNSIAVATAPMIITGIAAGNYTLTQPTSLAANITAKELTVTGAVVTSKTYDGTTPAAITGATLSGKVVGNDVVLENSSSGTFANSNVGTGKAVTIVMTISGADAGNYTLTQPELSGNITARPITISADAGQAKIYGGVDTLPFTYHITSGSIVTGDLPSGALNRAAGEDAGTYAIGKNTLTYGTNYAETYAGANFTISQQQVIVTATAGLSKVYGAADPATFTYTFAPALVSPDVMSGAIRRASGENAGTYAYTIGTLTAGPNYSLTIAALPKFTITPKPVVVTAFAGQSKVYGASDPLPFAYTVAPALVTGDAITGTMGRVFGENVGTYAYTAGTLTAGSNYSLSVAATPVFSITPRFIVVTAVVGQAKVYGTADPVPFAYTVSPSLVGADIISGVMGRVAGENVGNYAYTLGTMAVGANYSLSIAATNVFNITPKAVVITPVAGQSKVYGAADPVSFTYSAIPALVGADVIGGAMGRVAGVNVGTYDFKLGTLTASNNYNLSIAASPKFSITPKPIIVTAVAGQKKVYGTADPVPFTYTFAPALAAGDAISGALGRAAGENTGSYAYTLGSLSAGANYTLSASATPTFSITTQALTITAVNESKCYDGAVYSGGNSVNYSGFVNGDNSTVLGGTLVFTGTAIDAVNAGSYTIIPGGLTSGNYSILFRNGTLNINSVPAPTISGLTTVCAGTTGVIYTTEADMSGYVWTVSEGGTISAGAATNSITVTWNTVGPQTVSVNCSNANGCTAVSVKDVAVNLLTGNAGSISGTAIVCFGSQDVVYSVAPISGAATYEWTLPTGASIVSGAGTRSITADFTSNASPGNISVYGSNPCGNGNPSSFAVTFTAQPGAAGIITGSHTFIPGSNGLVYSVDPIVNATAYHWTVPEGATITSGANTNSITVNFGTTAAAGNITVYGSNACGDGAVSNAFDVIIPEMHFDIYPVPSDGLFTAAVSSSLETTFTLRIFSYTGHKILEINGLKTTNGVLERVIDLRPIPSGIYYVEFLNGNFKEVRKVLINKK